MMDQIAGLVARGIISPDAADNFAQQIAYRGGPGSQSPFNRLLESGGSAGPFRGGGASGEPTINPASIASRLQNGKSYSEIAEEFGVSRNAIAGKVRDWGLRGQGNPAPQPSTLNDPAQWQRAKDLRSQGMGLDDLANETGTSKKELYRSFGRAGEPARFANSIKKDAPVQPSLKFQQLPAPEEDAQMQKAINDYLKSIGVQ